MEVEERIAEITYLNAFLEYICIMQDCVEASEPTLHSVLQQ